MPRRLTALALVLLLLGGAGRPPLASADEPSAAPTQALERALANPPVTGLLVVRVVRGSQADEVGVVAGQVLVTYDGRETPTIDALRAAVAAAQGKESVELVAIGPGKQLTKLRVVPGRLGVELRAVVEGQGVAPLPPATAPALDLARLKTAAGDHWYAFHFQDAPKAGFEHATSRLDDEGRLVLRREVAFDGAEAWGLQHFDVTLVVALDGALPRLVSLVFENPLTRYVGRGTVDTFEDGSREWHYAWRAEAADESGAFGYTLPTDLPAIPTYLVESVAAAMPREKDACLHYRPIEDGSGEMLLPAALICVGPDPLEIDGAERPAWRYESRPYGGDTVTSYWVDEAGHVLRGDYGGAITTLTTKARALEGLNPGLGPRTAD